MCRVGRVDEKVEVEAQVEGGAGCENYLGLHVLDKPDLSGWSGLTGLLCSSDLSG